MSPEQAAGKRAVPRVGPVLPRHDPLRDGHGPASLEAKHRGRNADGHHPGGSPADRERGPGHAHGPALDHRPLPRQGSGGALRLDPGPRPRPGDASGSSRRGERRRSPGRRRRRAARRAFAAGALCSSASRAPRPSGRAFSSRPCFASRRCRTGLRSAFAAASSGPGALPPTARRSSTARPGTAIRSASSRRGRDRPRREHSICRRESSCRSRATSELAFLRDTRFETLLLPAGHPRAGRAGRRASRETSWKTSRRPTGLPTARNSRSPATIDGKVRLEYPIGKTLYETDRPIGNVRMSRDGAWIAFSEGGGEVTISAVRVSDGLRRVLSEGWFPSAVGLAWSADGREIWFTPQKQVRDSSPAAPGRDALGKAERGRPGPRPAASLRHRSGRARAARALGPAGRCPRLPALHGSGERALRHR